MKAAQANNLLFIKVTTLNFSNLERTLRLLVAIALWHWQGPWKARGYNLVGLFATPPILAKPWPCCCRLPKEYHPILRLCCSVLQPASTKSHPQSSLHSPQSWCRRTFMIAASNRWYGRQIAALCLHANLYERWPSSQKAKQVSMSGKWSWPIECHTFWYCLCLKATLPASFSLSAGETPCFLAALLASSIFFSLTSADSACFAQAVIGNWNTRFDDIFPGITTIESFILQSADVDAIKLCQEIFSTTGERTHVNVTSCGPYLSFLLVLGSSLLNPVSTAWNLCQGEV